MSGIGSIVLQNLQNPAVKLQDGEQVKQEIKQRRMGVEPTRDAAETPPNSFEDCDQHRLIHTSIRYPRVTISQKGLTLQPGIVICGSMVWTRYL